MSGFTVSINGIPEAKVMFDLASRYANKASREFVTKIGRIAAKEEKREEPYHRTDALHDAQTFKIPSFNRLGYYIAVAGTIKSMKRIIPNRKNKKGNQLYAIPAFYAHLVEGGTVQRYTKLGQNRGIMPKNSFTERAFGKVSALAPLLASQVFRKYLNG